jgi:hypothetical protein
VLGGDQWVVGSLFFWYSSFFCSSSNSSSTRSILSVLVSFGLASSMIYSTAVWGVCRHPLEDLCDQGDALHVALDRMRLEDLLRLVETGQLEGEGMLPSLIGDRQAAHRSIASLISATVVRRALVMARTLRPA